MKRLGRMTLLAVIAIMAIACGSKQGKVIPRSRFAQLYASLFIADAWLDSNPGAKIKADTTNFYLPIVESYGYTAADYRKSVRHYLEDPARFSKIIEEADKIIQEQVVELESFISDRSTREDLVNRARRIVHQPVLFDTLIASAGYTDKFDIAVDELGRYEFRKVLEDTLFYGPRLIIWEKDSLAVDVADSLETAAADSLAVAADSTETAEAPKSGRKNLSKKLLKEAQL